MIELVSADIALPHSPGMSLLSRVLLASVTAVVTDQRSDDDGVSYAEVLGTMQPGDLWLLESDDRARFTITARFRVEMP